ncbi:DUF58 domain-containing protein [Natronorubrum texcoconense]|uniref:Conserved repeat domain-containing protein n=1 Tax=Natronorubrum texcoconense TaxID=1095776 RepID=A0A1G9DE42_9EURY|nr:DUF58 domain-containing protein [Natronorubrum texcoconense]SDK62158.1 conserved repeat domain-containing protein [Natronorubrum texcoconense]
MNDELVRGAATVLAAVSLAIGVAVFVARDRILDRLSYEVILALEVFGQLGFYLVLLLFLVQSYRIARDRYENAVNEMIPPARERATETLTPGDDRIRTVESIRDRTDVEYRTIREQLDRLVRDVLERSDQRSETDSSRAVAEGTWTGDDVAAEMLSDDETHPRSRLGRLFEATGFAAVRTRYDLRRTMTAIAAVAGVAVTDDRRSRVSRYLVGRPIHAPSSAEDETDPVHEESDAGRVQRRTGHWDGVSVIALIGIVLGVLYQQPTIILAGGIGVGFAAYGQLSDVPELEVTVDRVVSEPRPEPGDDVGVTVTIRNDGNRRIRDLRVIDGVPPELTVTSGSPRMGTTLGRGETVSLQYTISARRGRYQFDPALLLVRTITGATETEHRVSAESEPAITCLPTIESLPSSTRLLQNRGSQQVGQLSTNKPSAGVEFHSVREFHPSDPVTRIDWNRYARDRELATVSFHEDRSAVVIVAIDARTDAYCAPATSEREHAVDRSVSDAATVFGSLLSEGHSVGLASIGQDPLWLAPNRGTAHLNRGQSLLGTAAAIGPQPPESEGYDLDRFTLAPSSAQILLFTPLCDDGSVEIVHTLRSRGVTVTIVSPDPTITDSPERALARVERRLRIQALRSTAISVVDRGWNTSLDRAIRGSV